MRKSARTQIPPFFDNDPYMGRSRSKPPPAPDKFPCSAHGGGGAIYFTGMH